MPIIARSLAFIKVSANDESRYRLMEIARVFRARVVDLAPLVKSRAVSSVDLTRMYLNRMKKYSPQLLCLITLTEEHALQQATQVTDV